jgi:hypothetical protein
MILFLHVLSIASGFVALALGIKALLLCLEIQRDLGKGKDKENRRECQ